MEPNSHQDRKTILKNHFTEPKRAEIDQQFDAMAEDKAYQTLQTEMAEKKKKSDWEALLFGEIDQSSPANNDCK